MAERDLGDLKQLSRDWDRSIIGRPDRHSKTISCQVVLGSGEAPEGKIQTNDRLEDIVLSFESDPGNLSREEFERLTVEASSRFPEYHWFFARPLTNNPQRVELSRHPQIISKVFVYGGDVSPGKIVDFCDQVNEISGGKIKIGPNPK